VIAYGIPLVVTDILQCNPITGGNFFDNGICLSPTPVLVASTILHAITDAWMIVMIIPVVLSLQIPPRQKWALMGVLSLGIFVILAAIGRIVSLVKLGRKDYTFSIGDFDIWSVVEVTVGLICACAPTVRPLLAKIFPKFMLSRAKSDCFPSTNGAIALITRNHRSQIASSRADQNQKTRSTSLDNESEESLASEPIRMAHSAHYPEGPGPLNRNATHERQRSQDINGNEPAMGTPF
jgi:hypothetical protein